MLKRLSVVLVASLLAIVFLALHDTSVAYADCGTPTTVGNTTELNGAISAFNATVLPCDYEIKLTADITLTADILAFDNPGSGDRILIDGDGFSVSGADTWQMFWNNTGTTAEIRDINLSHASNFAVANVGTITLIDVDAHDDGNGGVGNVAATAKMVVQGGNLSGNTTFGIYNFSGTMAISDTTISGNDATGIRNSGSMTLARSHVESNTLYGIMNESGGVFTVTESVIEGTINGTATPIPFLRSAAILNVGLITITASTIANNEDVGLFQADGNSAIANSTFAGNPGGGVFSTYGTVSVLNSTLANNAPAVVTSVDGVVEVTNSILSGSSGAAGDCWEIELPFLGPGTGTVLVNTSLIETVTSSCPSGGAGNITGVAPLLGPLQDNGGPTPTLALLTGSPAIDAGVSYSATVAGLTTDQRGTGFPRIVGSSVDLGAFEVQGYTMTVLIGSAGSGSGMVTSDPAGIDCGATCSAPFAEGSVVTLTATPATDSDFAGWGGDCQGAGTGICVVTMDAARNVTASFFKPEPPLVFDLAVVRAGNGVGTVTSVPAGINCGATCTAPFAIGSVVTLTASAGTGSVFTGWSGACSGTGNCVVTMSGPLTATASFEPSHPLSVTKAGNGVGTVMSVPAGINCGATCTAPFASGTVVTLTASAGTGSVFTGWSGACGGKGTCAVTMTAAKTVTATFALQPNAQYTLSVMRTGNGTGTVTSSPAGINCGTDCEMPIISGTVVTLTATTDAVTTFGGWSGGSCQKNPVCVVTVTGNTIIAARFDSWKINLPIVLRQDAK